MAESMGLTDQDTTLVVVPQFHVNAWGLPHATFMTGVNMLMPDRFLQPAPARRDDRAREAHARRRRPHHLAGPARRSSPPTPATSASLTQVTIGGSACPPSLMEAFDKLGMRVCHAWGMTETSPLGTIARPPARVEPAGGGVAVPPHPGPLPGRRRGPPGRPRRRTPALGRRVGRRAGGARPLDRGRLLRRRGRRTPAPRGQVQRGRLAEDRRRRHHQPRRLPHPHRPRQGRHQVRRRVDLLRRAGERPDGPPGRRRGRRRRRPGREVGRAPAGHRRAQGGRHRRLRRPCAPSSPTRASPSGSSRSAGRSSSRCRRRASASSTRR